MNENSISFRTRPSKTTRTGKHLSIEDNVTDFDVLMVFMSPFSASWFSLFQGGNEQSKDSERQRERRHRIKYTAHVACVMGLYADTALNTQITVVWDVTPCSLVEVQRRYIGT
jgi:hypothetical protein